jgi:diaminohydroxyphosphoribosylaminopyrimidine deaminase/5-amino-6-(5-phosphoribosylamino)uracil reductase
VASDPEYMQRAIGLAMRGRGSVEPNPMVGCVIVRDGKVIGEGYHQKFGGPHAEANALAACGDKAEGATAYTSLEPCCHQNKKTPPCAARLIAAKVARVVAACHDPNPLVSGNGIKQLREAGIQVDEGLFQLEAKQLNAAFFKEIAQRRPYVMLKWAQTADGKIAGAGGKKLAISNATSIKAMHELRGRCDAILVGLATVLTDDPLLTAREKHPPRAQMRVVLDSNLDLPLKSQLVLTSAQSPVLACCGNRAFREKADAITRLQRAGVEVIALQEESGGGLSLEQLLDELGRRGMTHLLVESGAKLAGSFLGQNLADRVWIFRSPKRVDAENAPAAATVDYPKTGQIALDGDQLTEYLNPKSPAFFSLSTSADLVWAKHGR